MNLDIFQCCKYYKCLSRCGRKQTFTYKNLFINDLMDSTKVPVFTVTRRGNPVLMMGGYRYHKHTNYKGTKVRWVCSKMPHCKVTIFTYQNEVFMISGIHNHDFYSNLRLKIDK